MSFDYEKFTNDLIEAKEKALKTVIGDKGGNANLDRLAIYLPRLNEEKVIEAIKKAGLWISGKHRKRYFINVPHGSQGNVNTRQIEIIRDFLKEKGYDVLVYYH